MEETRKLVDDIILAMNGIEQIDIKELGLSWWKGPITSVLNLNEYLYFRYGTGINTCDWKHLTHEQIKIIHSRICKTSHFDDLFDDINFFT